MKETNVICDECNLTFLYAGLACLKERKVSKFLEKNKKCDMGKKCKQMCRRKQLDY